MARVAHIQKNGTRIDYPKPLCNDCDNEALSDGNYCEECQKVHDESMDQYTNDQLDGKID